jgi:hypothetical protein
MNKIEEIGLFVDISGMSELSRKDSPFVNQFIVALGDAIFDVLRNPKPHYVSTVKMLGFL